MSDMSVMLRSPSLINWVWRLVMTGFCFAMFAIGGLALSLVWFNLLMIKRHGAWRRQLARRSISACFRFFLRSARALGVLDYRIDGIDTLRADRGCLIVANHPTLIDYVLLASVMPDVDCLVKAELRKNPFFSGVIRTADYLLNSQSDTLLPACQERLSRGESIIIFPEGTRTRYGEPIVLQRGAANIAVRCGCDMRVVHIRCSERTLGKQSRWYHVPAQKPTFSVTVQERIANHRFVAADVPSSLAARRLNHYLQQSLTLEK